MKGAGTEQFRHLPLKTSAQVKVEEKSNEITAIPDFLKMKEKGVKLQDLLQKRQKADYDASASFSHNAAEDTLRRAVSAIMSPRDCAPLSSVSCRSSFLLLSHPCDNSAVFADPCVFLQTSIAPSRFTVAHRSFRKNVL